MDALKELIRHVPDFPKPGILFYDITTLLRDRTGFRQAVECLAAPYRQAPVDVVAGIESRGLSSVQLWLTDSVQALFRCGSQASCRRELFVPSIN